MHRQTNTVLTPRQPGVHAPRGPLRQGASSGGGSARRTSSTTACSRTGRAGASSSSTSRRSTTCSSGSSPTCETRASRSSLRRPVPDDAHWHELEAMRDRFVAETEADLAKGGEHVRVRAGKEFVVRLHSYGVEIGLDDPWFRAVSSHRVLDLANAYLEMWSKLEYVDVWYSVPQPAEAERISSQRWHRDYNDKHLLKVFLYLVDVDEQMGPFQYVPGSQPGGPYADAWPWQPLGQNYPTEEELEALDPVARRSARSRLRRARSSSATRPVSTAAASRRRARASWRRPRTRHPPRSRRSPSAATRSPDRRTSSTSRRDSRSAERYELRSAGPVARPLEVSGRARLRRHWPVNGPRDESPSSRVLDVERDRLVDAAWWCSFGKSMLHTAASTFVGALVQ